MRHISPKITYVQFVLLIFGVQVGIGVISLPRILENKAGTSGWISLLFGGLISFLISVAMVKLREKDPSCSFNMYFTHCFGKVIGTLFSLFFTVYCLGIGFVILLRSILFIQSYILPDASLFILLVLFLIPTYQFVTGGIQILGKYIEIIFPIIIFFLIMLLFTLKQSNIHFILPLIKDGWLPIFKAIPATISSFLGIEIIFIIYPYLDQKEKALKGVLVANSLTTFVYVYVSIICFVIYSPDEISVIFEPVLDILSVIEFQYVERLDFILFSLFLIVISKTWIMYLWIGVTNLAEMSQHKRVDYLFIGLSCVFLCLTNFFIPTFKQNDQDIQFLSIYGVILILVMLVFIWIRSFWNKVIR
ncbi:GerAB/ArcD/ProY family transporter [Gottfriedia sp. NPDC056225]|uniref:GerAB/ArcD/ProY family transporter n=1 Tax=Gottfriedia sp. NPDC056225 TaxID=3345751 RepID=UPI00155954FF|nr:GerAB/ArcD/ProY family transporter [Arthrobacter citreus]